MVGLASRSIGNTTFSREKTQAAKYTQEAVEWLRGQRDVDWGVFRLKGSPSGTNYWLQTLAWSASSSPITGTAFTRQAIIIYNAAANPDVVEARVVTSWSDSAGTHESRVTTYFTNWRTR